MIIRRLYNTHIIAAPTKGVLWEEGRKRRRFLLWLIPCSIILRLQCHKVMPYKPLIENFHFNYSEGYFRGSFFFVIWAEVTVTFLLKLALECGIRRYQATFGMLFLETGSVLQSAKCL